VDVLLLSYQLTRFLIRSDDELSRLESMDQCACASAHKQKSNDGGPTLENDVSGRGKARRLDWDWDWGMSHKMMEEK
jgi:hypothetical protein